MINGIIAGIGKALSDEFKDTYQIYMEQIPQGFKEPCFFIQGINAAEKQFLNRRYKFNQSFVVQYFPEEDKISNEDMYFIAERMMRALEFIEQIGEEETNKLRGANRSYRIIDGVLNLFVDYNFFAYLEIPEEAFMEILNGNYQTKG